MRCTLQTPGRAHNIIYWLAPVCYVYVFYVCKMAMEMANPPPSPLPHSRRAFVRFYTCDNRFVKMQKKFVLFVRFHLCVVHRYFILFYFFSPFVRFVHFHSCARKCVSILWHIAHSLFNCSLKIPVMIQTEDGLKAWKMRACPPQHNQVLVRVCVFLFCSFSLSSPAVLFGTVWWWFAPKNQPHGNVLRFYCIFRAFVSSGMHLIHKSLFIQFIVWRVHFFPRIHSCIRNVIFNRWNN